MQKDEHKRALLCIANMCIGLTPLSRGHNEVKTMQQRRQNQDICRTDIGVWLVMTMHHNALVTMPYLSVATQNVLVIMHHNTQHTLRDIQVQFRIQPVMKNHVCRAHVNVAVPARCIPTTYAALEPFRSWPSMQGVTTLEMRYKSTLLSEGLVAVKTGTSPSHVLLFMLSEVALSVV